MEIKDTGVILVGRYFIFEFRWLFNLISFQSVFFSVIAILMYLLLKRRVKGTS